MEDKRLLLSLRLVNFLSYGSEGEELLLQPLNVLIGPNASGKSNLIQALEVLRALPRDLSLPFRGGGGSDYVWRGANSDSTMNIDVQIAVPWARNGRTWEYGLEFDSLGRTPSVYSEFLQVSGFERKAADEREKAANLYYLSEVFSDAVINARVGSYPENKREFRPIAYKDLSSQQSILSQRREPDLYPELTYVAGQFEKITTFREGSFSQAANPAQPDMPSDFLMPSGSNLSLVLNELQHRAETRERILYYLREFNPAARFLTTRLQGGTLQAYLDEGFDEPIPTSRLSAGTLRYLCLLTILCHPSPPPLVCLEEPELGLHPDILPTVAELLVDASKRTQLVVTTHSDTLVSALPPEAVVVCERKPGGTRLRKLDLENLREWLARYSLGELWRMGEIGGTR